MPRPQPQPNKLHDELDALLDGRPVELTEELAPLVEAAGALRAELAVFELDPEIADRHLERVLEGSGTVVRMPLRPQPNSWDVRRRVAAVVLAAALVLAPATMASAAALPGQPMYPFKLAIEQIRLASVQWSPEREAAERTRVADTRLDELRQLVKLKRYSQVPVAIKALTKAVAAATEAVREAVRDGAPVDGVAAKLAAVNDKGGEVVQALKSTVAQESVALPRETRDAIVAAADQSQGVLLTTPTPGTRDTTSLGPDPSGTVATPQPEPDPSDPSPTSPPPVDNTEPPETQTTSAPTTTQLPTTTAPPTTLSEPPTTPDTGTPLDPGLDQAAGGRIQYGVPTLGEAPPPTAAGP